MFIRIKYLLKKIQSQFVKLTSCSVDAKVKVLKCFFCFDAVKFSLLNDYREDLLRLITADAGRVEPSSSVVQCCLVVSPTAVPQLHGVTVLL